MTSTPVVFAAHVELLSVFIAQRVVIVDRIDQLLNSRKAPEYQEDLLRMSQQFKDCFFSLPSLTTAQVELRDALEFAHWASGFKPRASAGNDIIDPTALLLRGLHCWRQTRWPGQKGRTRYAHTLFNVYLLRCLTLLNMRLWDEDLSGVATRLSQVQRVMDSLWASSPADLIETSKASVQTGAGHLRSQLRHLSVQKGVPPDDSSLVLITRVSNALDVSLLMEGLVPLLAAYERALQTADNQQRLVLAAAITEGLSPDPELYVNRLDLLGPYTMIEHIFISTDAAGQASYTAAGKRHLTLLADYKALITRLAPSLYDDCLHSRPVDGEYSPYGVLFGFSSNISELIAFKTLQLDADVRFSMEDAFTAGGADKRLWFNGWRNLPHIKPEVVKQFEYSQQFAEAMQMRVELALKKCVINRDEKDAEKVGRLFVLAGEAQQSMADVAHIAELPLHYIVASDPQLIAAHKATAKDQDDLLYCRLEGEFIVSYQTVNGWHGITKDMLTDVLGEGRDARLVGLPLAAAEVLQLMCPELVEIRAT